MRVFEAVIILINLCLMLSVTRKSMNKLFLPLSLMDICILILHGTVEGFRWQMSFCYLMVLLFFVISIRRSIQQTEIKIRKILLRAMQITGMLLLLVTTMLTAAMPVFRLPATKGEYPISTMTLHVIDESRPEIYTEEEEDHRELMVTLWYPADSNLHAKEKPYITNLKDFSTSLLKQEHLPGFLLNYLSNVHTNVTMNAPVSKKDGKFPLLLFSHGMGVPTEFYTSILSEVASHGYVIAAIEHPYSTVVTTFPDGRVTDLKTSVERFTDEQLSELEKVWARDTDFVLEQLESGKLSNDVDSLVFKIDFKSIGCFGHSFGGAVSYLACFSNDRIKAGINLDGSIYSNVPKDSINKKAFLLLTTDDYAASIKQNIEVPDYSELDDKQLLELQKQGITREQYVIIAERAKASNLAFQSIINNGGYFISIENTKHYNFTDLPFFSPVLQMTGMVGKIDKEKGLEIINNYIVSFYDEKLKGISESFTNIAY